MTSTSKLLAIEIVEQFRWKGKTEEEEKMFIYFAIFENHILCLKTDGDWYCRCRNLKFGETCDVSFFIKCFEELREQAAQHYLGKQTKEYFKKILLMQEEILKKEHELD